MNRPVSNAAFSRGLRDKYSANNVASHAAFSSRVISNSHHDWSTKVVSRLNELCALPVGWNGYTAPPVLFSNASFALVMLQTVCPFDVPEPQIVPGPNGDLQIEWHEEYGDVELHVRAPYNVHAWRCNETTGPNGEEFDLNNEFSLVASWLADLSETSIVAETATA